LFASKTILVAINTIRDILWILIGLFFTNTLNINLRKIETKYFKNLKI
jgi:hypothetical protein